MPPALAVVGADGGRLQTRGAAKAAAGGADEERQEAAQEAAAPEEAQEALAEAGQAARWAPPEVQRRHLAAPRRPWAALGPMVAALAWRQGFCQAPRRAFGGGGSDNVWAVWREHFSSSVAILDIIHAVSYVFASATAGRRFADGWPCYVRWMGWVWQGEVAKVIAALARRQAGLGAPPEQGGETRPARVASAALGHLRNHKDKTRYPEHRRQGLPITSSYVESAVKQLNERLKARRSSGARPAPRRCRSCAPTTSAPAPRWRTSGRTGKRARRGKGATKWRHDRRPCRAPEPVGVR